MKIGLLFGQSQSILNPFNLSQLTCSLRAFIEGWGFSELWHFTTHGLATYLEIGPKKYQKSPERQIQYWETFRHKWHCSRRQAACIKAAGSWYYTDLLYDPPYLKRQISLIAWNLYVWIQHNPYDLKNAVWFSKLVYIVFQGNIYFSNE